jgi:hypothetical protein
LKAVYLSRVPKAQHRGVVGEKFKELGHNLDGCCDSLRGLFGIDMPAPLRKVLRKRVLPEWSVEMRYMPGRRKPADARAFLAAVSGVLAWAGVK